MIEVLDIKDNTADHGTMDTEPTISIAALTGIQPCTGRTMQVFITIRDKVLRELLDSGLTHNFIDSEVATRVGIIFNH
jgi:hypothetical protein